MKPSINTHQKSYRKLASLSALLFVLAIHPTKTQANNELSAQTMTELRHQRAKVDRWLSAPWSDDAKFTSIRDSIDRKIAGGTPPPDIFHEYDEGHQKHPESATAEFAYYYAAYRAHEAPQGYKAVSDNILWGLDTAVIRYNFPSTYNLTRLYFISEAGLSSDPHARNLGAKLYKKNPRDFPVAYYYACDLGVSKDAKDRADGLALFHLLESQYPNNARVHEGLGWVYFNRWWKTRNSEDSAEAIREYNLWIPTVPSDDPARQDAENSIAYMKR